MNLEEENPPQSWDSDVSGKGEVIGMVRMAIGKYQYHPAGGKYPGKQGGAGWWEAMHRLSAENQLNAGLREAWGVC